MPDPLTRRVHDAFGRLSRPALLSIVAAAAIAFTVAFAVTIVGSGEGHAPEKVKPAVRGSTSPGAAVPLAVALRGVASLPELRRDRHRRAVVPVVVPVPTAAPTATPEPTPTPTPTPTVAPPAPVPVAPQPTTEAPPPATPEPQPTFDSSG